MSVTRIVLVRHGESAAQAGGFVGGHEGCQGLSELGRRQARALAERLSAGELGPVAEVYASVMQRAVETAEILAPALGHRGATQDCDLCELHPGDADGLTWDEVARRWPASDDGDDVARFITNAETWDEMHERVGRTLERLADRHRGETVLVACHGGVVAHAMFDRLRIPPDHDGAWLVATNTSLTEFVRDETLDDWRAGRWGVVRYNDAAHLVGLSPPG